MRAESPAVQQCCPYCSTRQYHLNEVLFSRGQIGCRRCGAKVAPMSQADWDRVTAVRAEQAAEQAAGAQP